MFSLAAERRVCGQFDSRPTVAQPSGLNRRACAADARTHRHRAQFYKGVGSDALETMSDWRLTRPTDLPGQAIESADYVLIAEIVNIQHWQQQAERRVQALADDLDHLVSSRRMLVLERIL